MNRTVPIVLHQIFQLRHAQTRRFFGNQFWNLFEHERIYIYVYVYIVLRRYTIIDYNLSIFRDASMENGKLKNVNPR